MHGSTRRQVLLAGLFILSAVVSYAQVSATAPLSGTVSDPTGAVVPGARITVRNDANGAAFQSETGANGVFTVPALPSGTYTVTVTAGGFRQAQVHNVKMDVGVPTNIQIGLEVGSQAETVMVEGQGAILQTQSATISTTLTGRQIVDLPLVSRDALDLVLFLPGVSTPGRPRTSTINGLPQGAINITLDGINVQDNLGKSTDGYFTYIRPRLDAIQEVTIATGAAGADSTGEGAIQIKFVTRGGTNDYRGSIYWTHRNPALNANYWFTNRDTAPNPRTGKAPNARVLLNEPGFRVGGPISIPGLFSGRNRAFFFVNYEEFRLPEQTLRNRTILHPDSQLGIFRYNAAGGVRTVDLMALARNNGHIATFDPTVSKLLGDIRASTTAAAITQLTDPNQQRFSFINTGGQLRRFPTIRLDFNLTSKHSLEMSYNFQDFAGGVDFLNNYDPAFPGFPNQGGQGSNRFSGVIALRSTLTARMVNEFRAGVNGGTVLFAPEVSAAHFNGPLANQQGFTLNMNNAIGIQNATSIATPSRRNTPVKQINDNLSLLLGSHNFSVGGSFTQVNSWSRNLTAVPTILFGTDSTDAASAMFVAGNFQGASATDLNNARALYAVLTGRVTQITANAFLSEENGKYEYIGPSVGRFRYREMGTYFHDNWRVRPNFTFNYGLRWEVQFPYIALNNRYSKTSYAELFGVSGQGNLFKPGTLGGKETEFLALPIGEHAYNTDFGNLAPSIGISWTPDTKSAWLGRILGLGGKGVLRAGYSIAYDRESASSFSNRFANNPGGFVNATRSISLGNLGTLPLLLRDAGRLGPSAFQPSPIFPTTGVVTDAANGIDPNLKLARVHSWSAGIQRELGQDIALEIRYVGNTGQRFWTALNLNETNIVESGWLNEFKLAQANLQANIAAGRGSTFRYFGAGTGTSPLPISLAYFSGVTAAQASDAARYTSTQFANSTFVNRLALHNPAPTAMANDLLNDAARRASALAAGLPVNLFRVNPGKLGGANVLTNFGGSSYHAATVELRKRFSRGLLFNVNYTLGKAMEEVFLSWRRFDTPERAISPLNIAHVFKLNWIYELPVGRGRSFLGSSGRALDLLVGGWAIHGTGRVQSGTPFSLGNVRLVGMTRSELQDAVKMRFDDGAKIAYYLPQDVIDNTIRGNNVSATSSNGYGSQGAPNGRYIAPASGAGCIEVYNGQCGSTRTVLTGPMFTRFDIGLVKKVRVSERVNIEMRGEFLNAFNNVNFIVGNASNATNTITNFGSQNFGQVTEAYRDTSTTNDPGGRLVQLMLRINF